MGEGTEVQIKVIEHKNDQMGDSSVSSNNMDHIIANTRRLSIEDEPNLNVKMPPVRKVMGKPKGYLATTVPSFQKRNKKIKK